MTDLNELTTLQFSLAVLDAFLTRKPWVEVVETAKRQKDVEAISQSTYYLSDGGYSRIGIRPLGWYVEGETFVFLDSVSRGEVKANWSFCKELIEDVAKAATDEWRKLGYS